MHSGNVEDLYLSFEANEDVLGTVESHELKFVSQFLRATIYRSLTYFRITYSVENRQR